MTESLQKLLTEGSQLLEKAGIEEALLDAKYLLMEAFHLDMSSLLVKRNDGLPDTEGTKTQITRYQVMLENRSRRIPLQYIIGTQDFMGMTFRVDEHVLIPRQDTETLVELVLKEQMVREHTILDMCTGSGCIAVSLKKLGHYQRVAGVDISREALAVASENAKLNQCDVEWILSDMFEGIVANDRFDVIVSNPPYIPTKIIEGLEPEVREHEPMLALDGTEDGLYFYRRLAAESGRYLKPGGSLYVEIGYDQGAAVSGLFAEAGFTGVEVIKDLPGLDRIVKGYM